MIFVRGIAGIMFKQLAFVISFSLICSLVRRPDPGAHALQPLVGSGAGPRAHGWKSGKCGPSTVNPALSVSLENGLPAPAPCRPRPPARVLLIVAALLVGSIALVRLVGSEFMPTTDEGEVRLNVEMEVGTRLAVLDETLQGDRRHPAPRGPGDGQHRGELRGRRLAARLAHR